MGTGVRSQEAAGLVPGPAWCGIEEGEAARGGREESQDRRGRPDQRLLALSTLLLPRALSGQRLFRATLVPGLEVEGVFLDVLDDVFLLHFPLEAAERAFNGLAFLNLYFCQDQTPPSRSDLRVSAPSFGAGPTR
jgi:hypothetical protein